MMGSASTSAYERSRPAGRRKRVRKGALVCSILHLCGETRRRIADYDPRLWSVISVKDGHALPVTTLEDADLCAAAPDLALVLAHARQAGFRYVVLSEDGAAISGLPLYPS